jgi:microcystin-dependent protein
MADPFIAEIRMVGFNFAPVGWATCDGQLLPIAQNTAVFSLLGTTYGGDGKTTFALPNLQGSVPIHFGQGPGLSQRVLGETGGADNVTLLQSEIPAHTHGSLQVSATAGNRSAPGGNVLAPAIGDRPYAGGLGGTPVALDPSSSTAAGGSLPHNNLMPYLVLTFCIALTGIFPPRN